MPDHLAIVEAFDPWGRDANDIYILSIGTTHSPMGVLTDKVEGWGLFKWGKDRQLITLSMSAQMALASEIATRLLPSGHRVRIDPALGAKQAAVIGLDVTTAAATETLQALAQREAGGMALITKRQFLSHSPVALASE